MEAQDAPNVMIGSILMMTAAKLVATLGVISQEFYY
jgi:hypothetical protein